ncbi:MAG: CTP synthase [Candidatus Dojkabacteria bacterium]|nr:MAG: CTP synthase [Candidatus Dojkabacteria bacterium]
MLKSKKPYYIFVSGGVISALGKGVTAASISLLLKKHGYKVCPIKCENNLNWDFGTINPIEHGDPFLCADGLEGDMDLGNYERFLDQEVGFANFMTMGQLYLDVIKKERSMKYNGEDVEPIPHIVNEIIERFDQAYQKTKADFLVVELGGTVGEYENNNGLYYEAARILGLKQKVANIHVTYVPVPPHIGEPKTKPAQFGIKHLMTMGIFPNFLIVRSEIPIDDRRKYKFALKFHIPKEHIISNENLDDVHRVPIHLHSQKLDKKILEYFDLPSKPKIDISEWKKFVSIRTNKSLKKVKISIVGKYFGTGDSNLFDSYYALIEALKHGAVANNISIDFKFINSEKNENEIEKLLVDTDGVVVPIGWGARGVPGKIKAIKFARENNIPYLGLCYGMQLACIEFARNVAQITDADTEEINPNSKNLIIHSIPFDQKYQVIKGDGTSMRLGTFECKLKPNSVVSKIYVKAKFYEKKLSDGSLVVKERHRHRFEFNNDYRELLESKGLVLSGVSLDNFFVEFIELPKDKHRFFVGTQGHPEYRSTPNKPHPLFVEFINVSLNFNSEK